ncbi:hypothetical protein AB0E59_14045 [Lentzea sp. NPDC034063]|uniref:hypothetical protein n=1 Tax=unclassified Lentzea TaxID=2643253 RepID=UPI0033C2C421
MKIFRHLTTSVGVFCLLIAAGAFALAVVTPFAVDAFTRVELSAWNVVMSQIARWFLFWVGIYLIHNLLPIAVAHGRTRREFLAGASAFAFALALGMAVFGWLGFLVEGGIYSLMDWQSDEHASPVAYFLMFLVWSAAGMFCAAAFDRFGAGGVFSIPIVLPLVAVTTVGIPGSGNLPFIPNLPVLLGSGWHLVSVAAFLVALAGTWAIARTMPVRVRTT